ASGFDSERIDELAAQGGERRHVHQGHAHVARADAAVLRVESEAPAQIVDFGEFQTSSWFRHGLHGLTQLAKIVKSPRGVMMNLSRTTKKASDFREDGWHEGCSTYLRGVLEQTATGDTHMKPKGFSH